MKKKCNTSYESTPYWLQVWQGFVTRKSYWSKLMSLKVMWGFDYVRGIIGFILAQLSTRLTEASCWSVR